MPGQRLSIVIATRPVDFRCGHDALAAIVQTQLGLSQLGEQLWRDYQDFAARDLSEHEIIYLFVDGIAERIRPGQRREPVMAAWGFTASGGRVLLHRKRAAAPMDFAPSAIAPVA